ncbi:MAG: hypothetical protein ACLGHN_11595 [Bacteriovoracia bacterium]
MQENPVDTNVDNSIAAIFTMMLPGLGQMLKRRIIPGIFWSVAVGGGYLVNGWLGLFLHVLCILDAAFGGNLKEKFESTGWFKRCSLLIGLTVLLIYTCLRTALF